MCSYITAIVIIEMLSHSTSRKAVVPLFSTSTSQNVKAVLGEHLLLHCQVDHLGHHTVSWIRQKDLQILTVGSHKFTTDNSISVKHDLRNGDFMLSIRLVSEDDLGLYECQINTSPVKTRVVDIREDESLQIPQTANRRHNTRTN